jgi:peptidyl-prolyl cis-trans isomerase C
MRNETADRMGGILGKRWRVVVLAAALALLAGCARQPAGNSPPEPGDKAVATVDGQTVWASDVKREAAAEGLIGEGEPLDASSAIFHQVLDEVIDQKLLAAEAVRRKLQNDPSAKRAIAAARERILGDRLVQAVVASTVTDRAINDLYHDHQQLAAETEEFRARQIVSASQADGLAIRKQLAGGAAFEALAMDRSTDAATRFNGGDLGYFTLDMMPEPYSAALGSAKPGDIVGPFKADAGWVVLRVEDRRAEQPISMDAARPQIVRFLTYEQVGQLLRKLRGKAQVKLLIGPVHDVGGAPREPASAPTVVSPDASAAPSAPVAAPASSAAPPANPAPITESKAQTPLAKPKPVRPKPRPLTPRKPAETYSVAPPPQTAAPAPIQPPPVPTPSESQP